VSGEDSFQDLMDRLRSGDDRVAAQIFRQYARRLAGLARTRLAQSVRSKLDPEDIVQSVFRSFFVHQREGQYEFADWNSLWSLLALITLRKCGHRVEHYRAACRDVSRELAPPATGADSVATWQHIAREPTPSEAVMLIEVMDELLKGLGERDRRILELSLQGENTEHISEQVGCSERTVERVLERIRTQLEVTGLGES
jgi:RNA polymerase sigma-70 factor (ECF subfamily)